MMEALAGLESTPVLGMVQCATMAFDLGRHRFPFEFFHAERAPSPAG